MFIVKKTYENLHMATVFEWQWADKETSVSGETKYTSHNVA